MSGRPSDAAESGRATGGGCIVSGARLERWVWGRARREWSERLAPAMRAFADVRDLWESDLWAHEGPRVERWLASIQAGGPGEGRGPGAAGPPRFAPDPRANCGALRFVHWNILKGIDLGGILAWLEKDPRLARPDLLLLSEVDVGMARSGNCHVAAEIAARLGLRWAFAPNFLELTKGPGTDALAPGENAIGLHGVAMLSRRPPFALARAALPECFDMFAFAEKRYGGRAALLASFPGGLVTAVAHLEVRHSPACRATQMRALLRAVDAFVAAEARAGRPVATVVLSGDWNTHTFPRGSLGGSLRGMARIVMTPGRTLERQLMEPWRSGREPLFEELARAGYVWQPLNDRRATAFEILGNVEELGFLPGVLRWGAAKMLGLGERRIDLRLDWFAARSVAARDHPAADAQAGPLPVAQSAPEPFSGRLAGRSPADDRSLPAPATVGRLNRAHRPSDHLPIALDIASPL